MIQRHRPPSGRWRCSLGIRVPVAVVELSSSVHVVLTVALPRHITVSRSCREVATVTSTIIFEQTIFGGIWANMAQQQWRIRVTGKQRTQVSIDLLVAAVMALGEQFGSEQQREQAATSERPSPPPQPAAGASS